LWKIPSTLINKILSKLILLELPRRLKKKVLVDDDSIS
jgi:hypothetical protein